MIDVDDRLLGIIEDLVDTLELREASEPDVPRWEADARIRRLEGELVRRYRIVKRPPLARTADIAMAGVF